MDTRTRGLLLILNGFLILVVLAMVWVFFAQEDPVYRIPRGCYVMEEEVVCGEVYPLATFEVTQTP